MQGEVPTTLTLSVLLGCQWCPGANCFMELMHGHGQLLDFTVDLYVIQEK